MDVCTWQRYANRSKSGVDSLEFGSKLDLVVWAQAVQLSKLALKTANASQSTGYAWIARITAA